MSVSADDSTELVIASRVYQEFLAERNEILRHKWFESEKAGYDVGFDLALVDWCVRFRSLWRAERKARPGN